MMTTMTMMSTTSRDMAALLPSAEAAV